MAAGERRAGSWLQDGPPPAPGGRVGEGGGREEGGGELFGSWGGVAGEGSGGVASGGEGDVIAAPSELATPLVKEEARAGRLQAELGSARAGKWDGLREQVARLEAEAEGFRGALGHINSFFAAEASRNSAERELEPGRHLLDVQEALRAKTEEVKCLEEDFHSQESKIACERTELTKMRSDLLEARASGEAKLNAALSAASKERVRALTLEKELQSLMDSLENAMAGRAEDADNKLSEAKRAHLREVSELREHMQALEAEAEAALVIKERYEKELVKVVVDRQHAARTEEGRGQDMRSRQEELQSELDRAHASASEAEDRLKHGLEEHRLLNSKLQMRNREVSELQSQLQLAMRQSEQDRQDGQKALTELLEVSLERDLLRVRAAAQDSATRVQQAERGKLEAGLRKMLDVFQMSGASESSKLQRLNVLLEEVIGSLSSCVDAKLRLTRSLGRSPQK